jgi:hypothetical protein
MGLFSRDAEAKQAKQETKAARHEAAQTKRDALASAISEKARAQALKKGLDVDGAVAVGYTYDDSAVQFLLVFPDRIELVNLGKTGSLFRSGAGTTVIPTQSIATVSSRNSGLNSIVSIASSGADINFETSSVSGPFLRDLIQQLRATPSGPPAAGESSEDVGAKLRTIADLHASGVLSDDEFAEKKAELLKRL